MCEDAKVIVNINSFTCAQGEMSLIAKTFGFGCTALEVLDLCDSCMSVEFGLRLL